MTTENTTNHSLLDVHPITELHRTKIIATLGPATESAATLTGLILAGINVVRLNLSHGTHEQHIKNIALVRQIARELDKPLAILADLQGPKLRTGPLKDERPIRLTVGEEVRFSTRTRESSEGIIGTKYQEVIDALEKDSVVLIDDGKIRLKVLEKTDPQTLRCQILQGGMLEARKGINIPGSSLAIGAMTQKDKDDLLMALQHGVDYLALSFVQRARDIAELREFVEQNGYITPPVIAKIEKPQALHEIDNIMHEADGIMVARGDLGVELNPEEVPVVQKHLVLRANQLEKPVIIATQMLESMIASLQPSRSDVSDIANAVFDGADCLMLSGETSIGAHPIETVSMMRRIIEEAEKSVHTQQRRPHEESRIVSPDFYHAIAHSASYAAAKTNVKALVVLSSSGSMAQRVSKLKPSRPIIALTQSERVYHRMSLLWGVTPLMIPFSDQTDKTLDDGETAILERHLLQNGDSVVFCAGNTHMKGATNMLKIYRIGNSSSEIR